MNKRKLLLVTGIFFLVITGLRVLWLLHYHPSNFPSAVGGVMDLRGANVVKDVIPLNGEWLITPWNLVDPGETGNEEQLISIPGKWKSALNVSSVEKDQPILYGTYKLRVLLNETMVDEPFALYVKDIRSAFRIFVNGELVSEKGKVATTATDFTPSMEPVTLRLDSDEKEFEILIQIADKNRSKVSGMNSPLQFGTMSSISREHTRSIVYQILSSSILVLHFMFAIILFFSFSRRIELLYLAMVFGSAATSILIDDDRILLALFPSVSIHFWTVFFYISYVTSVVFLLLFFKRLLTETREKGDALSVTNKTVVAIYLLYIFLLLWDIHPIASVLFSFIMLVVPILIALSLFQIVSRGMSGALFLLLAMISIANNIGWAALKTNTILVLPYYPFDIIIAVLCFAIFWFKRFFAVSEESQALASRLQQVNEQKDEFLANTSHELRNPLQGIMSISQTIYENEPTLSAESKSNLETLISVSKRMSSILNDLLDVQRLKEGRVNLQVTDVDLSAVVAGAVDTVRFMTKGKQITFAIHISEQFPYVRADENRLFQVLFNLLHNAVKFTEHGEIIITAKMEGAMAVIRIQDPGIGMDDETLKSIFHPYVQADSSMTTIGGGLGLGLTICDQLVRLHGGKMDVSSQLNEGSVFMFSIPIGKSWSGPIKEYPAVQKVENHSFNVRMTDKTENRPKILVVDDDPLNLSIIEQILQEKYDVTICGSAPEALVYLDTCKWELIISDVMMPRMSGFELIERVRERYTLAELPILLLTARDQVEDIQTGFHFGASDYLIKPIDRVELVSRVKAFTDLKLSLKEQVAMEAAWLQAQIQPHFLFNTLNTIAALSDEDPQKMMKLLDQFGVYLNASFMTQNLSELIPLEQELELVQAYVYIEQERFGDRLQVEWHVDTYNEVFVPPLSIQTLVENAINHGILRLPEGGIVKILIIEHETGVDVSIKDDGMGMDKEKVWKLLQTSPNSKNGIGLLNTDKRLKQLFGRGLTITSVLYEGTTVTFTIPN
ncbi:hybrid sensor histidine kinase/response regulator [Sporosarcina sp. ITBMC105]